MDDSFIKAPLAVPRLSGFDKSHQNLLTSKVGTITPILCDELIPGTKVNLKLALNASLPPLATDTFMRCSIKVESFFCPMRLLSGGFEAWFTDEPKDLVDGVSSAGVVSSVSTRAFLPVIKDTTAGNDSAPWVSKLGNGTLADYLGIRTAGGLYFKNNPITALPFLAYHRIYNDWYRNSLIQKECFLPSNPNTSVLLGASVCPYVYLDESNYIWSSLSDFALADGHSLLDLRQRNFGLDYFTTATPSPQQGTAMKVSFDTSGNTGEFSIGYLRSINSMQQFKERNNLLGNIYVDQLYGRYGVRPSDGIAQRSLYLGRGDFEVYSKGVYQSNNGYYSDGESNVPSSQSATNPFGAVGSRYGSAYASGENFLVNFEAKEPGYLMVMATLVPRVTYSSGVDKMMHHYVGEGSLSDMANPILQNVGPQPIYNKELTGFTLPSWNVSDEIFGYTDRYAEFKTKQDTLHGLVRDGSSLESFALQRTFSPGGNPIHINSSFLEIPTDYMDNITAVKAWISEYGFWLDTYFDYRVAMPLSKYSLPTLQDPAYEHGRTIVVDKGGSKL